MLGMSTASLCCLAIAVVCISGNSVTLPPTWILGQEYTYSYTTQVLSGIPQIQPQYAGVRLTFLVRIQPETANNIRIKLDHSRHQTYNQRLDLHNGKEAPHSGEDVLEPSAKLWLEKPFKVNFQNNGIFKSLEYDMKEPQFAVNIKRGLVSQLQLDLANIVQHGHDGNNQIHRPKRLYMTHFMNIEESVIGSCETTYNIIKLSKDQIQRLESEHSDNNVDLSLSDSHCRFMNCDSNNSTAEIGADFEIVDDEFGTSHNDDLEREKMVVDSENKKQQNFLKVQMQQFERMKANNKQRLQDGTHPQGGQDNDSSNSCSGKEYFEIVKTRNLQKCKSRPIYEHSFGASKKEQSSLLPAYSSITRTLICGSPQNFIFRKTTTENHAMIDAMGVFQSHEKIDISSYSVLKLIGIQKLVQIINDPSDKIASESLIYQYSLQPESSTASLKKDLIRPSPDSSNTQEAEVTAYVIPDIKSAPHSFLPLKLSSKEIKDNIVKSFWTMMNDSLIELDSSQDASLVINIAEAMARLSLNDLEAVEHEILSKQNNSYEMTSVTKFFYDIVSISGSNPAIKLIIERTKSQNISMSWDWPLIVSNTIRSTKLPSEEILRELVQLLKDESVTENDTLYSAIALTLTDLIKKACMKPYKAPLHFPIRIYGQLCSKDSDIITRDIFPYLSKKIYQSSISKMTSLITDINAIGNLEMEDSVKILLKVAEGRISPHPLPRTLAIYNLIAVAQDKPSHLRQIFQAMIENPSENSEVRVAAVAALTHSYPSSADLQRLAVRTWYENSEQVASYIYSTLKRLANLSDKSQNSYLDIKAKAKQAIPLAKPDYRTQTSKVFHSTSHLSNNFVDVHRRYQIVYDKTSPLPKSLYYKENVIGEESSIGDIDYHMYIDGGQEVIEQIKNLFQKNYDKPISPSLKQVLAENMSKIKQQLQNMIIDPVNIQTSQLFLRSNYLGLHQLSTLNSQTFASVKNFLLQNSNTNGNFGNSGFFEHKKAIDFYGHTVVFPTESGLPAFISIRNPAIMFTSVTSNLKADDHNLHDLNLKQMSQFKNQVEAGVAYPITDTILATGVESSIKWRLPMKMLITSVTNEKVNFQVRDVQQQTSTMPSQEMFKFSVQPYTASKKISSMENLSKFDNMLPIRSATRPHKTAWKVGKKTFGLDLTVHVESDRPVSLTQMADDLKNSLPLAYSSPPFVKLSPRTRQITLWRNPGSGTKTLDIILKSDQLSTISLQSKLGGQTPKDDRLYDATMSYEYSANRGSLNLNLQYNSSRPATIEESKKIGDRKTFQLDINFQARKNTSKAAWNRDTIINDNLSLEGILNAQYSSDSEKELNKISGSLLITRSDEQKEFCKKSEVAKMCDIDEQHGNRMSNSCKLARAQLSELDRINLQVSLPTAIANSPQFQFLGAIINQKMLPFLQEQPGEMSARDIPNQKDFLIGAQIFNGRTAMNIRYEDKSSGFLAIGSRVPITEALSAFLSISSAESISSSIFERMTSTKSPASCTIENDKVTTFDHVKYAFKTATCKNIYLSERSMTPRIFVTFENRQSLKVLTAMFDNHEYTIEVKTGQARGQGTVVKVNGNEVDISQGENYFPADDPYSFVTRFQDDVYAITNSKHDISIKIDSQTAEIKASPLLLKNNVMGLCGDLNDEKMADIKTPGNCIMTSNTLGAMSYVIERNNCQALTQADLELMKKEEKECVKDKDVPTKVFSFHEKLKLFNKQLTLQHLVQERQDSICFSKALVKTCSIPPNIVGSGQNVTTIKEQLSKRDVKFVCLPRDESQGLKHRAEAGDTIADLQRMPVAFKKTVYEPIHCN